MFFNNIIASSMIENGDSGKSCVVIDAEEENGIEDIHITDFIFTTQGGMKACDSLKIIPTHEKKRAEGFNYKGQLPAYGLFARNASGVCLRNFQVRTRNADERDLIYSENCSVER